MNDNANAGVIWEARGLRPVLIERCNYERTRATLLSLLCQPVGSFIAHDARVRPDLDHTQVVRASQQLLNNPKHQVSMLMALQAIRIVQSFTDEENGRKAVCHDIRRAWGIAGWYGAL